MSKAHTINSETTALTRDESAVETVPGVSDWDPVSVGTRRVQSIKKSASDNSRAAVFLDSVSEPGFRQWKREESWSYFLWLHIYFLLTQ